MTVYRIAQQRYASLDGIGASLFPQRWNLAGQRMVYAAESLAVARMELLVHIDQALPPRNHVYWEIDIPDDVIVETLDPYSLPRWHYSDMRSSRRHGGEWFKQERSVALVVPSKASEPGRNVLLNPLHPDFVRLVVRGPFPLRWDPRLFLKGRVSRTVP